MTVFAAIVSAGRRAASACRRHYGAAIAARLTAAAAVVVAGALSLNGHAVAAPVYIALGDSITFGETDLLYRQSFGDRGYPARFLDTLASRSGGVRPALINLAIDGETAASFMTGSGRTPPVVGRTDVPLQLENLNYSAGNLVPQGTLLRSVAAAQQAMGNTIGTVTVTLGFNELAALASLPPSTALAQIAPTLAAYTANYSAVLTEIRDLAPNANLYLLGYYNPFPADPTSPAAPIFNAGGAQLNAIIRGLAAQFGAAYVDNFTPFLGHEAEYTFLDEQPHGSTVPDPFGGVLPIGNVHPNERGYDVIAADLAAAAIPVLEPSTWAMLAGGLVLTGGLLHRRRRSAASGWA